MGPRDYCTQPNYGNYNPASGNYDNRADNLPADSELMDLGFANEYRQDLSFNMERSRPASDFNIDYRKAEGRGYNYNGIDALNDVQSPEQRPRVSESKMGETHSAEQIVKEATELLRNHPNIEASEIVVSFEDGCLVLSGTVEDRRTKRAAEDCALSISTDIDVLNELRVNPAGTSMIE